MKVGLSLSFCVKDMIRALGPDGTREEPLSTQDILMVISGTAIRNDEEFAEALEHYAVSYWYENPQMGKWIAQQLWDEGKVYQPKLSGEEYGMMPDWHRQLMGQGSHWLTVDPRRK